eukprot:TRINITY_DN19088_c1_g1_i2.p1 TRINITY_DN19088_c1_g1~~TRINITY_DN19088_c1_g1_i2.p1  ORF type:complete len:687 (-),score=168.35 TRINITY_DN19088_c1_g1_i2:230-2290(-)
MLGRQAVAEGESKQFTSVGVVKSYLRMRRQAQPDAVVNKAAGVTAAPQSPGLGKTFDRRQDAADRRAEASFLKAAEKFEARRKSGQLGRPTSKSRFSSTSCASSTSSLETASEAGSRRSASQLRSLDKLRPAAATPTRALTPQRTPRPSSMTATPKQPQQQRPAQPGQQRQPLSRAAAKKSAQPALTKQRLERVAQEQRQSEKEQLLMQRLLEQQLHLQQHQQMLQQKQQLSLLSEEAKVLSGPLQTEDGPKNAVATSDLHYCSSQSLSTASGSVSATTDVAPPQTPRTPAIERPAPQQSQTPFTQRRLHLVLQPPPPPPPRTSPTQQPPPLSDDGAAWRLKDSGSEMPMTSQPLSPRSPSAAATPRTPGGRPSVKSAIAQSVEAFVDWCAVQEDLPVYEEVEGETEAMLMRIAHLVAVDSGLELEQAARQLWDKIRRPREEEQQQGAGRSAPAAQGSRSPREIGKRSPWGGGGEDPVRPYATVSEEILRGSPDRKASAQSAIKESIEAFTAWCATLEEMPPIDCVSGESKAMLSRVSELVAIATGLTQEQAAAQLWDRIRRSLDPSTPAGWNAGQQLLRNIDIYSGEDFRASGESKRGSSPPSRASTAATGSLTQVSSSVLINTPAEPSQAPVARGVTGGLNFNDENEGRWEVDSTASIRSVDTMASGAFRRSRYQHPSGASLIR